MTDAEISYNKIVGAVNIAKEECSIYTNNKYNSNGPSKYGLVKKENYVGEVIFLLTSLRQVPIQNDKGRANTIIIKNVLETVMTNFQWSHKNCAIKIDANFVKKGKTTSIIGIFKRFKTTTSRNS